MQFLNEKPKPHSHRKCIIYHANNWYFETNVHWTNWIFLEQLDFLNLKLYCKPTSRLGQLSYEQKYFHGKLCMAVEKVLNDEKSERQYFVWTKRNGWWVKIDNLHNNYCSVCKVIMQTECKRLWVELTPMYCQSNKCGSFL